MKRLPDSVVCELCGKVIQMRSFSPRLQKFLANRKFLDMFSSDKKILCDNCYNVQIGNELKSKKQKTDNSRCVICNRPGSDASCPVCGKKFHRNCASKTFFTGRIICPYCKIEL